MKNKVTTMALSFSLVGSMMFTLPGAVYAAEGNTTKEENVYATLNEDGSVQGIYVVNAYDLSKDTTIIDYGSYTSLKNLTNENPVSENGDKISVDASKGKFYYQGNLETKDLPWNIGIHYYLDGKEVKGEELAGQSGALKIEIQLKQNKNVDASFFDNYLLQATVSLPSDLCTNIAAEGATIANMSGDKQILFNVMGGQEKNLTITSDVTDFEMSAISFKGVPMSFDVNVDDLDTSELTDRTEELNNGVTELNDGAEELKAGTSQLQAGLLTYTSGVDSLYSGAATLVSGVDSLQSGTTTYTDAVSSLSSGADTLAQKTENLPTLMESLSGAVSELYAGSAMLADSDSGAAIQIAAGLDEVEDGLKQMKAGLVSMNEEAVAPMIAGLDAMEIQMAGLENGMGAASQYVMKLQEIDTEYQREAAILANMISDITAAVPSSDGSDTTQIETSQETTIGEPQITTDTQTVTGEYQEDHTDTETEQSIDEDGNTVTIVTNRIYMTRDNTTTVTNNTTTNTETVITNTEKMVVDTNSFATSTAVQLGELYKDMAVNAGTLDVVLNGDGSQTNPGLVSVLEQCQSGVEGANQALFTGTETQQSLKNALLILQVQLVGEDGGSGAAASVQAMIDGIEAIKYNVSDSTNPNSLQSSLSSLNSGLAVLDENTTALPSTGNQLISGINSIQSGLNQLNGNSGSLKSGISSLQSGAKQLSSGAGTLADNNNSLLKGMDSLSDGMSTLKDGTQKLSDKTSDMDDQIMDTLEDKISNFTGQDYDGISFVSSENMNVDAVQFAVLTKDIKVKEVEVVEEAQEKTGILDKFKDLFTK